MEAGSEQFIVEAARLFMARMGTGQALWQNDVRVLPSMPVTVTDDGEVPLSGGNALLLAQAMWDRGWRDPRFVTPAQALARGARVRNGALGLPIQFVRSGELVSYLVSNASEVDGLAPWAPRHRDWPLETLAEKLLPKFGVDIVHDQADKAFFSPADGNVHMPPPATFASLGEYVGVAVHELSHALRAGVVKGSDEEGRGDAAAGREELRVELASMQLSIAVGIPHDTGRHKLFVEQWQRMLEEDPGELFRAARDAEKIAAVVLKHVKAIEKELASPKAPEREAPKTDGKRRGATGRGGDRRPAGLAAYEAKVAAMFEDRQAILAVPYEERGAAQKAGAVFYGREKVWFVPAGVDMAPLSKWSLETVGAGQGRPTHADMIADFEKAMKALNLSTVKAVNDNGKWQHVPITNHPKNKNNRSGSYILNLAGGRNGKPTGTIMNRFTGETLTWTMDCPGLSEEHLAAMRAQALAREKEIAAEVAARQETVAIEAQAMWAKARVEDHGYCRLKGVQGHGLRVLDGSALLRYSAFKNDEGKSILRRNERYALVPLMDESEKIWGLQAISEDGKTKAFMSGGRKKGLYCVLGPDGGIGGKLPTSGMLGVVEGFATGATMSEAMGCPVVVCFDAGNLETFATEKGKAVAATVDLLMIGADNDQFFMERAFGALAKIGVVARGAGPTVKVTSGIGEVRELPLGAIQADGEWHDGPGGKYKMTLEADDVAPECVGKVSVEILRHGAAEGQRETLRANNRGMEAARVAATAMRNAVVVTPSFDDLSGRPTDWNDLGKAKGPAVVADQVNRLVKEESRRREAAQFEKLVDFAGVKKMLGWAKTDAAVERLNAAVETRFWKKELVMSDEEWGQWTKLVAARTGSGREAMAAGNGRGR